MQVKKEKIIRTAIIGLGKIAHGYGDIPDVKKRMQYPTHLSVFKKDKRFELVAAADASAAARRAFRKKVPRHVALYADYGAMLKKEDIDLLVVAVPTRVHYIVCADALRAGIKNILCEKPITSTLAEAEKLRALSKRHRATLFVNYQRSYSRGYQKLMGAIAKKGIGRIVSVSVRYNNGVFNTATHFIHLLEKMFGPIRKVQSAPKRVRGAKDPNISFTAFARGFNIFFEGAEGAEYPIAELDVWFKKKRLALNGDSFVKTSMLDLYENAYQAVRRAKKPGADITSSIHALKVAAQAIASAKTGKRINV